jgi:glycosyltransferase involved in cell wall biosynthesis
MPSSLAHDMKVYHILAHSLEAIYPKFSGKEGEFANLDHTINRFISQLMKYGGKEGYEHVLVNLSSKMGGERMETLHKGGYKVLAFKCTNIYGPIEYSMPLIKFIRENREDAIFHVHGTSSYVYDIIAPFLKNKKFIAHYRGGHLTLRAFPILFPKYWLLAPFTFRMPKLIFVQNKTRIEKLKSQYWIPRERLVYLPNGVDIEGFGKGEPGYAEFIDEKFKIGKNAVTLLFAGRLVRGKGIPLLLRAFAEARKKNPELVLLIAGEGPLEKEIGKYGDSGVHCLGHVGKERLISLYGHCDAFVFPSEYDSFPNAVLEAMASGAPVLATATEGATDLVKDGESGFLVKVNEEGVFLEKMILLSENEKLREEMGKKGKENVRKTFLWKDIMPNVLEKYSLLGKGRNVGK